MLFILISGKRYSGKDFTANKIKNICKNVGCEILHFADILKKIYAKSVDEPNYIDIYNKLQFDHQFKEEHRNNLIKLSKDDKLIFGETIWVERLLQYINDNSCENVIIIPDCRFEYELSYLLSHGYKVFSIRIISCAECRKERGWIPNPLIDHDSSECDLDNYYSFDCIRFNCPHVKFIQ
jgi:phosphomevalonate kinase